MTRFKLQSNLGAYDFRPIVFAYMSTDSIKPIDEIVKVTEKDELELWALYAQAVAMDWGLA